MEPMILKVTDIKLYFYVSIVDPNAQSSFHLSRYRIRSCIIILTRILSSFGVSPLLDFLFNFLVLLFSPATNNIYYFVT